MFKFHDCFTIHNENMMPYSVEVEKHTTIDNLHAAIEDNMFALKSIGNRFIFKTPSLRNFSFSTNFGFTILHEFNPSFTIAYHYNKKTRKGFGITLTYNLNNTITISHIEINCQLTNIIDSITFSDVPIIEGILYPFCFTVNDGLIMGNIVGNNFSFKAYGEKGYIAISRNNYIGMCLINDFTIESSDIITSQSIFEKKTFEIPLLNGGDIPYTVSVSVVKENECTYLCAEFDGGTITRPENKMDRPGQYVAEVDIINSLYIRFLNSSYKEKLFFFNKEEVFADPNIYWNCLNDYWGVPEMPLRIKIPIPENVFSYNTLFVVGYKHFFAKGYASQQGGPSEFVFDMVGNVIYSGSTLENDVFSIHSPADKKIISYIDKSIYNYDDIKFHLENNHYFIKDETINLDFSVLTKKNTDFISVSAEVRNIFDTETLFELKCYRTERVSLLGLNKIIFSTSCPPLPHGVYRAVFTANYGNDILIKKECVFECIDPLANNSPAIASSLPYCFSMPNEHKWLSRNTFDLWSPMPSCDVEHYISCATDTPIEAEYRKVWDILPIFKREWFAWLTNRTVKNWDMSEHIEVIKNCNYLNYFSPTSVPRFDLFLIQRYTSSTELREFLIEFLDNNPQFKNSLSFTLEDIKANKMTHETLRELFDLCINEWFTFAIEKIYQKARKENELLRSINPNIKRSTYGPFNQYATAPISYHSIRSYGWYEDERLTDEHFSGFAVFEDYPFSCSYQTYRGIFGAMTTLLYSPNLVLYPEQYKGSTLGGCIDGAVKFAHSPMGANNIEPYMNSTSGFEYVFNTPQLTKSGYKYWNTYGFHRADFPADMWDKLIKDWKYVIKYKPCAPKKSVAFIVQYSGEEDKFDMEIKTLHDTAGIKNRTEDGHGYIYECCREAGLNAAFVLKPDTVEMLSETNCDFVIIPSLEHVNNDFKKQLRKLNKSGITLLSVSNISGLEDIFGVKPAKITTKIDTIIYNDSKEHIYPIETEFLYESNGAEVLLETDNHVPIVLKKDNAIIVNAPVNDVGYECFEGMSGKTRRSISSLLRKCIIDILKKTTKQGIVGENVGISIFETEKGDNVLLAIDYSPYDNKKHNVRKAAVNLTVQGIKDIKSEEEITILKNASGDVVRVEFDILPHGFVFMELI